MRLGDGSEARGRGGREAGFPTIKKALVKKGEGRRTMEELGFVYENGVVGE